MGPSFSEIFTDFNSDGWAVSLREFFGYFVKQFLPFVNTQIEKLYFARLDYPLIVFPFYLLAIISLVIFWKKPSVKTAVIAGATAGFLFYSYFHFWVYWSVVIVLLFIYAVIKKQSDEIRFKHFLILLAVFSVIAVPYFINYFQFQNSGTEDMVLRLGIAQGYVPGLATLGYAYLTYGVLAIVIYSLYWKKRLENPDYGRQAILFWALLAAMVVIWNIQIILGYVPAPNNWRRTISPIMFVLLWSFLFELYSRGILRWQKIKTVAACLLVTATILVIAKKIVNVAVIARQPDPRIVEGQTLPKEILDSWRWINENLEPEPKIMTNSFISSLYLGSHTGARPYLPIGILTPMPTEVLENRFLIAHRY